MPASTAIYIGTGAKGILGLSSNAVVGMVIDDISFDNVTQEHEYLDINGDVTSCAYDKHEINISINGRVLSGTAFTNTVASALTLESVAKYLPAGYTVGGTTVISNIKQDQKISDYQTVSITAKHFPKIVSV
jgi:hypothetical protein